MKDEAESFPRRSQAALALGLGVLHTIGRTWRITIRNAHALEKARATGHGFVFSLWHGQLLPLLWQHRGEGVVVLISEHRDGELVARAATALGFGLIRGSTTRGAGRALIAMVRALKSGQEVAITPDGPRGPAGKFAPGALIAAQRSDVPILPVGVSVDRAWRLKSWDRFMIPKPFARVTIAYGEPEKVDASDARGASREARHFENAMSRTIEMAGGDG